MADRPSALGAMAGHAALIARLLESSGDFRVLRRLRLSEGVVAPASSATRVGVVVDVETTGTDVRADEIIELALRRFRFDDAGVITKLDRAYTWLEEPTRPIDPAAAAVSGLTAEALRGEAIDDDLATAVLRSAHVRIAFNSAFDRPLVERRLPRVAGLPWGCAMREIDYRARDIDGGSLGWILAQCGFYNDRAHQAAGDVDATIAILRHRLDGGPTALFELVETASRSGWRIAAVGAHFAVKDALKARRYRWDPEDGCWWREVKDADREAECAWLADKVYAAEWRPRMDGPSLREVTWCERYA